MLFVLRFKTSRNEALQSYNVSLIELFIQVVNTKQLFSTLKKYYKVINQSKFIPLWCNSIALQYFSYNHRETFPFYFFYSCCCCGWRRIRKERKIRKVFHSLLWWFFTDAICLLFDYELCCGSLSFSCYVLSIFIYGVKKFSNLSWDLVLYSLLRVGEKKMNIVIKWYEFSFITPQFHNFHNFNSEDMILSCFSVLGTRDGKFDFSGKKKLKISSFWTLPRHPQFISVFLSHLFLWGVKSRKKVLKIVYVSWC